MGELISKRSTTERLIIAKTLLETVLQDMPTAEPRKGKWIEDDDATVRGHCSVCGWKSHYYEDDVVGANYCPNCGARMEGESDG